MEFICLHLQSYRHKIIRIMFYTREDSMNSKIVEIITGIAACISLLPSREDPEKPRPYYT